MKVKRIKNPLDFLIFVSYNINIQKISDKGGKPLELTRAQENGLRIAVDRYYNNEKFVVIAGYA